MCQTGKNWLEIKDRKQPNKGTEQKYIAKQVRKVTCIINLKIGRSVYGVWTQMDEIKQSRGGGGERSRNGIKMQHSAGVRTELVVQYNERVDDEWDCVLDITNGCRRII